VYQNKLFHFAQCWPFSWASLRSCWDQCRNKCWGWTYVFSRIGLRVVHKMWMNNVKIWNL